MRNMMALAGLACVAVAMTTYAGSVLAADHAISALSSPDQFQDADGDNETTIMAGDTVTWSWSGGNQHNVKAVGDAFTGSGPFTDADTHTVLFDAPGTFPYYCEVHGAPGAGMHGTIIVQAASNTPAPTNTSAPGTTNTATRTPTRTTTPAPTSTGTVTVVPTSAPGTATPVVVAPISATEPPPASSGRAGAITAPATGSGGSTSQGPVPAGAISIALVIAGALMIGGAAVARIRR